jgi:Tfp pilus assembly protein PilF/TolB-like protein
MKEVPPPTVDDDRLESWKDIAAHLGRGIRTVQRWEAEEGLPVRRHTHKKLGTVQASKRELDAWLAQRQALSKEAATQETAEPPSSHRLDSPPSRVSAFPKNRRYVLTALVMALTAFVGGVLWRSQASWSRQITSVGVLPFKNDLGASDLEYLVSGIAEEIVTRLSAEPQLRRIAARSAVARLRPDQDPSQAARQLGVEAILSGRLSKAGSDLVLDLELVGATGERLWGRRYRSAPENIPLWAEEVVSDLHLNGLLAESPLAKPSVPRHPANTGAYEAYLRGRQLWERRTYAGIQASIQHFRAAIDQAPSYALAYAGLADAYNALGNMAFAEPRNAFSKAKAAAQRALAIDPWLAEGHAALALTSMQFDWDFSAAEAAFRKSIELGPRYGPARQWYGMFLCLMGRFPEAEEQMSLARAADPLSAVIDLHFGWVKYEQRQFELSISLLRKTLELDPEFILAKDYLAWAYLKSGQVETAIALFEEAYRRDPRPEVIDVGLGEAWVRLGQPERARAMLRDLESASHKTYIDRSRFAILYAALGDLNRAFAELEAAYQQRYPWLTKLKVDPSYDGLRNDPRFESLLRRVGFVR